jgi:two-component system sensor histidine kinase/response regulator
VSFRLKTILGIALIEGSLLFFIVWSSVGYLKVSSDTELALRAQVSAEAIANLTRDAVLATDLARLDGVTKRTLRSAEVVYVRIIDTATEQALSQAGSADALARPFAQDRHLDDAHDGVFDVGVDIAEGDYVFGRVELGVSVARANQLLSAVRQHLSGLALTAMVLVALFSYILGTYLTRGLGRLAQAARAIHHGALGALVDISGTDELAQTGKAFNAMSIRLAESQREMERNVTTSKALTVKLAEKEQRLATILDTAIDGFVTINQQGIIDDVNAAGAGLFGYDTDELPGRNLSCLMQEADRSAHGGYLQRYLETGQAQIIGRGRQAVGLKKDGSTFAMDLAVSEMMIGTERMFVGLVRDLSKQLQAEAIGHKSEAMRAAIVDANLDALVTIDADDRIIEFNAVAENTFGYRRDAILGQCMADLLIPPQMRDKHRQGLQKYLATREGPVIGERIEVQALRASGELFPVELTVQPIDVSGEVFFTALIRDISDRKAREQALLDARHRAELASDAKSRFLAHMSHEIRSPLSAVLGTLDLLLDDELNEDQRLYANTAQASGKTLLTLINDILDFSKIEAGRVDLEESPFDVRDLVDETMDLTAFRAREKGVYVAAVIAPAADARIRGDKSRLLQILTNLLDNALKFTDIGAVVLTVDVIESHSDEVTLRFTVDDSGIGIAPEAQASLFDEFSQVDNSDSTHYGGTGLGLSICQGLAKLMGGTLGLHSEPGKGSRFWLDIRLAMLPTASVEAALTLPFQQALAVGFPPRFAHALQRMCAFADCGLELSDEAQPMHGLLQVETGALLVNEQLTPVELDTWAQHARAIGVRRMILLSPDGTPSAMQRVASGQYDDFLLSPLTINRLNESLQSTLRNADPAVDAQPNKEDAPHTVVHTARILLAEDSVANQLVATAMLRRSGYTVEVANNGREVVDMFAAGSHDLILMDLRMPQMDGLQASAAIRALPGGQQVPIIALTANVQQEDIDRCMAAGMDGFASKPIDKARLIEMLVRHLPAESIQAVRPTGDLQHSGDTHQDLDGPLINEDVIRQLREDVGEQVVPEMMTNFMNEISMRANNMITSQRDGAFDLLEAEAHTVKSCAGTFGAFRLQALARDIEAACRNGNRPLAKKLGGSVTQILQQTQHAYQRRFSFLSDSMKERVEDESVGGWRA